MPMDSINLFKESLYVCVCAWVGGWLLKWEINYA